MTKVEVTFCNSFAKAPKKEKEIVYANHKRQYALMGWKLSFRLSVCSL